MPVHIDEVESEVRAESTQTPTPPPSEFEERARLRRLREQLRRDSKRTAAEGFDD